MKIADLFTVEGRSAIVTVIVHGCLAHAAVAVVAVSVIDPFLAWWANQEALALLHRCIGGRLT